MVITCHLSLQINPIGLLSSVSSLAYLHLRNHSSSLFYQQAKFRLLLQVAAGLSWLNTAVSPGWGKMQFFMLVFCPVADKMYSGWCCWIISHFCVSTWGISLCTKEQTADPASHFLGQNEGAFWAMTLTLKGTWSVPAGQVSFHAVLLTCTQEKPSE